MAALRAFPQEKKIQRLGCQTLAHLCENNRSNQAAILALRGVEAICADLAQRSAPAVVAGLSALRSLADECSLIQTEM